MNKTVRSEDSTTIERIDTLESPDEDCDPGLSAERSEAKERFRQAFAKLPARERKVAVLLYVEGRTLREIGARLGVSESRVSQIHTELRRRLREQSGGGHFAVQRGLIAPRARFGIPVGRTPRDPLGPLAGPFSEKAL